MTIDTPSGDITRRGLLKCSLWAGTGILWTVAGGVPSPLGLSAALAKTPSTTGFTFAQISDSHIGFKAEANPDPAGTLQEALAQLKRLPEQPSLLVHTGDVSHLSKPEEFDTAQTIIAGSGYETHYIPGEHDTLVDSGKPFFERFGTTATTPGWYSFDHGGVHFVALINVFNFKPGGLGMLGAEQLAWLAKDLAGRSASAPIVVLAHLPLWTIYAEWGWGTEDAAQAMALLKRFGSVTVLNGHIHQVIQKVEGSVTFHTAMSTAFPQPAPGEGPGPGPMKVPSNRLRSVLGVSHIEVARGKGFTVADTILAS